MRVRQQFVDYFLDDTTRNSIENILGLVPSDVDVQELEEELEPYGGGWIRYNEESLEEDEPQAGGWIKASEIEQEEWEEIPLAKPPQRQPTSSQNTVELLTTLKNKLKLLLPKL